MDSSAERTGPRWRLGLKLGVALGLVAALLALAERRLLPWLVRRAVVARLEGLGLRGVTIAGPVHASLGGAELGAVEFRAAGEAGRIERLALSWKLRELRQGRVRGIHIDGLELALDVGAGRAAAGGAPLATDLDKWLSAAGLPFESLTLAGSTLTLRDGESALALEAGGRLTSLGGGRLEAQLALAERAGPAAVWLDAVVSPEAPLGANVLELKAGGRDIALGKRRLKLASLHVAAEAGAEDLSFEASAETSHARLDLKQGRILRHGLDGGAGGVRLSASALVEGSLVEELRDAIAAAGVEFRGVLPSVRLATEVELTGPAPGEAGPWQATLSAGRFASEAPDLELAWGGQTFGGPSLEMSFQASLAAGATHVTLLPGSWARLRSYASSAEFPRLSPPASGRFASLELAGRGLAIDAPGWGGAEAESKLEFDAARLKLEVGSLALEALSASDVSAVLELGGSAVGDRLELQLRPGSHVRSGGLSAGEVALGVRAHGARLDLRPEPRRPFVVRDLATGERDLAAAFALRLDRPSGSLPSEASVKAPASEIRGHLRVRAGEQRPVELDGSLSLRGAELSAPALDLRLDGVEAELALRLDRRGTVAGDGSLRARAASWRGVRHPGFDGQLALDGDAATLRFTSPVIAPGVASGEARLDWSGVSPVLGLEARLPQSEVRDAGPLLVRFVPDAPRIVLGGSLAAALELRHSDAGLSGALDLSVAEGSLRHAKSGLSVQGLAVAQHFDSLSPLASPPGQLLSARTVTRGGLALQDVELRYQVEGPSTILVERIAASWLGGRLEASQIRFDPARPVFDARVDFQGVALREILAPLTRGKLAGDGSLSGTLALRYDGESVALGDGLLEATGPGTLDLVDDALIRTALGSDQQFSGQAELEVARANVVDAVSHLAFDALRIESASRKGERVISLTTRGRARDPKNPQEIGSLTINITGLEELANELLKLERNLSDAAAR